MPSSRAVLIHSCFPAFHPVAIGTGQNKIFHLNPNVSCGCMPRISYHDRDDKLARGELFVIIRLNHLGNMIPEWTECVLVGKQDRIPRAQSVESHDIVSAYVEESNYQYQRIESFGELSKESIELVGVAT